MRIRKELGLEPDAPPVCYVTELKFFTEVATLLAPTGVVIINIADGPGLAYARGQVATVAHVFAHVGVMAEAQVLKGRRFGNLVLVASNRPHVLDELPRLMARGPHPASSVSGTELTRFMGGALITTDATAVPSPTPQKTIFQMAKKN
jgi:hypothetical protein